MTRNNISVIAKNYGKALFELGKFNQVAYEEISQDLDTIQSSTTQELADILNSPVIPTNKKIDIFKTIFENKINEKILNFGILIIEKSRFQEFNSIIEEFNNLLDETNGIQQVEIISAIEINDYEKDLIISKLENKIHKNIKPTWTIDEKIIAGLMIKIDDNLIDLSVNTKLKNLSKNIR